MENQPINDGYEEDLIESEYPDAQEESGDEQPQPREYTDYEKQLYARAKHLEREVKELKSKARETPVSQDISEVTKRLDMIELKNMGYNEDEIKQIGSMDNLKNPVIAAGIEALRAKRINNESSVVGISSKSGVTRSFTDQDVANMSSEEYARKILRQ